MRNKIIIQTLFLTSIIGASKAAMTTTTGPATLAGAQGDAVAQGHEVKPLLRLTNASKYNIVANGGRLSLVTESGKIALVADLTPYDTKGTLIDINEESTVGELCIALAQAQKIPGLYLMNGTAEVNPGISIRQLAEEPGCHDLSFITLNKEDGIRAILIEVVRKILVRAGKIAMTDTITMETAYQPRRQRNPDSDPLQNPPKIFIYKIGVERYRLSVYPAEVAYYNDDKKWHYRNGQLCRDITLYHLDSRDPNNLELLDIKKHQELDNREMEVMLSGEDKLDAPNLALLKPKSRS